MTAALPFVPHSNPDFHGKCIAAFGGRGMYTACLTKLKGGLNKHTHAK